MDADKRLFSDKMLVQLYIPLVIEQGLSLLVGMVDGMMVSSVGEAAISGVSLVDGINAVMLVLFAALATGGAVVTSQLLGAGDVEKARHSAGQLVLMSAIMGLGLTVLSLIFARPIMRLFFGSIETAVMEAGLVYFRLTALSFPFLALYNAGAAIFRSLGNSKVSMRVSLWMNLINVGGNALCIYLLKMGVAGVAIPTLVSRTVAAFWMIRLAMGDTHPLKLAARGIFRMDHTVMGRILRIGVPSALENSFFRLGRLIVVSMIALFGTTQITANSVANTLQNLGSIPGLAMSLAMVTVVGRCVGARDMAQTVYYIKKLMKWVYLIQGACNLLLIASLNPLIGLYSSLSPETEALVYRLVMFHAVMAIFLWPASFVLPNALRAANDVQFTLWVGIGSMVCFRIFFSWILCVRMEMGAMGVWIAMIIDWVCRIVCFLWRLLSGKWKLKYKPS